MTTPADQDRIDGDGADAAALEEYLQRNSAISQRYREIGTAGVPPELDRAVLQQARAAVAARKNSRWRAVTRWSVPLALAASVVAVVSIVMQPAMQREVARSSMPASPPSPRAFPQDAAVGSGAAAPAPSEAEHADEQMDTTAASESAPAAARTERFAANAAKREKSSESDQRRAVTAADAGARQVASQATAVRPAPQSLPAPAAAHEGAVDTAPSTAIRSTTAQPRPRADIADAAGGDSALGEVAVTANKRQELARQGAGPRDTVPSASAKESAADTAFREEDPARWLDYIRQLRRDGESRQADRQWRRFRDQYPDYPVDPADLARAGK